MPRDTINIRYQLMFCNNEYEVSNKAMTGFKFEFMYQAMLLLL